MANDPQQPITWRNPFFSSFSGPDSQVTLQAFQDLSDWLQNPYFPNGIMVGTGGNPSLNGDVKIPPTDLLQITSAKGPPSPALAADGQIPTSPTGGGGIRSVTVFWGGAANTTYEVQLATDNTFSSIVKDVTVTGNVTSFSDLNPSTSYYFRVRGVGTAGGADSSWSAPVMVSTGVIGTADIAANTVTAAMIQAGVITSDLIAASGIVGDKILGGTITGTTIGAVNIYGPHISTAAVGYGGNHIELDGENFWGDGAHTIRFYSGNSFETGVASMRVNPSGEMILSTTGLSGVGQPLNVIASELDLNVAGGVNFKLDAISESSTYHPRLYATGTWATSVLKFLHGDNGLQSRNALDTAYAPFYCSDLECTTINGASPTFGYGFGAAAQFSSITLTGNDAYATIGTGGDGWIFYNAGGGSNADIGCRTLFYNGSAPTYTSSEKLKKGLTPLPTADALAAVDGSAVYTFRFLDQPDTDPVEVGLIAEQAPDLAKRTMPASMGGATGAELPGISLGALVGLLWGAVQELSAQVKALQGGTTPPTT